MEKKKENWGLFCEFRFSSWLQLTHWWVILAQLFSKQKEQFKAEEKGKKTFKKSDQHNTIRVQYTETLIKEEN